jgi:hypothetical protein
MRQAAQNPAPPNPLTPASKPDTPAPVTSQQSCGPDDQRYTRRQIYKWQYGATNRKGQQHQDAAAHYGQIAENLAFVL